MYPQSFAHGFIVLSKEAIISYKVDQIYHQKSDSGYKYDDPSLSINWKIDKKDIILSDKDKSLEYIE